MAVVLRMNVLGGGGVLVGFSEQFFNEFRDTFPCGELIKLAIRIMTHFQTESIYSKPRLSRDSSGLRYSVRVTRKSDLAVKSVNTKGSRRSQTPNAAAGLLNQ